MKSFFKKTALAVAIALSSAGAAQAGTAFLDGILQTSDGSQANAYNFGLIGLTPTTLSVNIAGPAGSFFEEYADFNAAAGVYGAIGDSLTVTLGGISNPNIVNMVIEVWGGTHPGGPLITSFLGNGTANSFTLTVGGQYHFDIQGNFGTDANPMNGQYSLTVAAVPEPETYAMLLAGLGLMGFVARRRKQKLATA